MRTLKVTEKEQKAISHALLEEHDRVKRAGGDQYGPLTLEELNNLINRLQEN